MEAPDFQAADLRWYAVWDILQVGRWRIAGLDWGYGAVAYSAILRLHNDEFKGVAFRRFDSRREAEEQFRVEAERFDLAPEDLVRVIGWSFTHGLAARGQRLSQAQ